jgi:two-component system cell cycle response regulator
VDVVGRYGGEEFVVVLPETPLNGAVTFAERIRAQIETHPFGSAQGPLSITVSVGVASYPSEGVETIDDLFSRADDALYRAKAEGRNAVAV